MNKKAFTLIELLVVVLIIGILAAIALPQYRVAVQKAKLARLLPLADALYKAEESYFLANGSYTTDLSALDVDVNMNCTLSGHAKSARYECDDFWVGVFDGPNNAQVILRENGNLKLAYLRYFDTDEVMNAKKGDTACFAMDEINRQVCRSLGPGTETSNLSGWTYEFVFSH